MTPNTVTITRTITYLIINFVKKGQPEGIYSRWWAACSDEKDLKPSITKEMIRSEVQRIR